MEEIIVHLIHERQTEVEELSYTNDLLRSRLWAVSKCVDMADGDYSSPEIAFYEIKNILEDFPE